MESSIKHGRFPYTDLNTSLPLDLLKTDLSTERLNRTFDGARRSSRFENGHGENLYALNGVHHKGRSSHFNGCTSTTERTSPMRGKHDLRVSIHDDDSGISQTLNTQQSWRSQSPFIHSGSYTGASFRSGHDAGENSCNSSVAGDSCSSSIHSPRGHSLSHSRCYGSVPDLQHALHDSEDRRQLLMNKLREAQDTIRQQARKMNETEINTKERTSGIEELKYQLQESAKKVENLEKERKSCHDQQIDLLCRREDLQKKLGTQDHEIQSLKSAQSMLQADCRRKQETIEQTIKAMNILEEENTKLTKAKDNLHRELTSTKESLDITRSRCDFLENERKERSGEIQTLRENNQSLLKKNESLKEENKQHTVTNIAMKEENKSLLVNIQLYNKEKRDLLDRISSLNSANGEMKATLNAAIVDKDRYFREHVEQKTQIQSFIQTKDGLTKIKMALEEQLNEANCDLAKLQLDVDQVKEEKRKMDDELSAVKKVGEVLSMELAGTKNKLEKMTEQNMSLEQTKTIAFRQHKVYEQEISSLEAQLDNAKKSLEMVKKDRLTDRENHDESMSKVKDDMRQLKGERNVLEVKIHELESRLTHVDHTSRGQADLHIREIEVWKNNCEKLTASLGLKDVEIQSITKRSKDLQDQVDMLKVSHDTHQNQYEDLVECRQELIRLQDENRRLVQEKTENQQVIQLLEMQKSILAKTSEDHLTKAHTADRLQHQADQLSRDNSALQDKVKELEKTKDVLFREREINCSLAATMENNGTRMRELEQQVEHLQNVNTMIRDQLTASEKENKVLKSKENDSVTKADYKILEREKNSMIDNYQHLKSQFSGLEERYHKLLTDKGMQLQADGNDMAALQLEKQHLESELSMVQSRLVVTEKAQFSAEEQLSSLRKELNDCKTSTQQASGLQKQVFQLQAELNKAHYVQEKQEVLIQSLREELEEEKTKKPTRIKQSLDDVGADLSQMRGELQKLMNVIQEKDQSIEQLESQLKSAHNDITTRDELISGLRQQNALQKQSSTNTDDSPDKIQDLEMQIAVLTRERDASLEEAAEARSALEDLENMFDEERQNFQEKLRKEITAKDRQIENLEDQLHSSTKVEIRRIKRGSDKLRHDGSIDGLNVLQKDTFTSESRSDSLSYRRNNIIPSTIHPSKITASDNHYYSDDSDTSTETDIKGSGRIINNDNYNGVMSGNALYDSLSSTDSLPLGLSASCDKTNTWSNR